MLFRVTRCTERTEITKAIILSIFIQMMNMKPLIELNKMILSSYAAMHAMIFVSIKDGLLHFRAQMLRGRYRIHNWSLIVFIGYFALAPVNTSTMTISTRSASRPRMSFMDTTIHTEMKRSPPLFGTKLSDHLIPPIGCVNIITQTIANGNGNEGIATWYGDDFFHGNLMANGEPFDMNDPTTAASNIYPMGTLLQVTNEDTGESIVVRVTDTGAFRSPIVVDLSKAAFESLAPLSRGVIPVSVMPMVEGLPVVAEGKGECMPE